MPRRRNTERPQKGGLIKFQNGMIGEVIAVHGENHYAAIEAVVDGVRTYADLGDVEVVNVLDRIANALNKEAKGD